MFVVELCPRLFLIQGRGRDVGELMGWRHRGGEWEACWWRGDARRDLIVRFEWLIWCGSGVTRVMQGQNAYESPLRWCFVRV